MFDRSRICEFSIPVGLFVLMLLLFPAAHGSFVATHGPVTTLRSAHTAALILLSVSLLHVLLTLHFASMRRAVAMIGVERRLSDTSAERQLICCLLC